MHLIVQRKHSVKLFIVVLFVFPEETKVRIQKGVKESIEMRLPQRPNPLFLPEQWIK